MGLRGLQVERADRRPRPRRCRSRTRRRDGDAGGRSRGHVDRIQLHPAGVLGEEPQPPAVRQPAQAAARVARRSDVAHPCRIVRVIQHPRAGRVAGSTSTSQRSVLSSERTLTTACAASGESSSVPHRTSRVGLGRRAERSPAHRPLYRPLRLRDGHAGRRCLRVPPTRPRRSRGSKPPAVVDPARRPTLVRAADVLGVRRLADEPRDVRGCATGLVRRRSGRRTRRDADTAASLDRLPLGQLEPRQGAARPCAPRGARAGRAPARPSPGGQPPRGAACAGCR